MEYHEKKVCGVQVMEVFTANDFVAIIYRINRHKVYRAIFSHDGDLQELHDVEQYDGYSSIKYFYAPTKANIFDHTITNLEKFCRLSKMRVGTLEKLSRVAEGFFS